MPDNPSHKLELRKTFRALRRAIDHPMRQQASHEVAKRILQLPNFDACKRFALYLPADGELETAPLCAALRLAQKKLFLPCIRDNATLSFALWHEDTPLQRNRYGILEPSDSEHCEPHELDIACLPLVAWDRHGHRLGMGGGYYDRSLEENRGPLRVGLGFSAQECPQLTADDWDINLDWVLTERESIQCGRRRQL